MKEIISRYFVFNGSLSRKSFWKGFGWLILFSALFMTLARLAVEGSGGFALVFVAIGLLISQWGFASLVVGRMRDIGIERKWIIPVVIVDLIPLARLGFLVAFGVINYSPAIKQLQDSEMHNKASKPTL